MAGGGRQTHRPGRRALAHRTHGPIDRNILRLATWEICEAPDIPDRVAIDQAIELAKRLSAAESGAFVNGVPDRVLRLAKGEAAVPASRTAEEPQADDETAAHPEPEE